MKKLAIVGTACVLSMVSMIGTNEAQDKKPKYTISEVMKKAMAGDKSLCSKVASGKATDAEKEQLVELFTALHDNMPKKGDAESWKSKTEALLEAAKKGDGATLKSAADCKACHSAHKGK